MTDPDVLEPPYLRGVRLPPERVPPEGGFPFDLPCVVDLDLTFPTAVTFLVGENGSGKSTLIEAIAEIAGLPASGGSKNELPDYTGPKDHTRLGALLRPIFSKRPRWGYFFRSEHTAHFGELLVRREADEDFLGAPYARYGGQSLQQVSHGESYMEILRGAGDGLLVFDEPEAALSPSRQLELLALLWRRVRSGRTQVVAATHSPILMTFPGATLLSLDEGRPKVVTLEETEHYRLTRDILASPGSFWKHLRALDDD